MANSVDPDQTASKEEQCDLGLPLVAQTYLSRNREIFTVFFIPQAVYGMDIELTCVDRVSHFISSKSLFLSNYLAFFFGMDKSSIRYQAQRL